MQEAHVSRAYAAIFCWITIAREPTMISPDDTTDATTGPYERQSRTVTRREIINEKRQRQTEMLPRITGETQGGKVAMRQVAHLREENKRLRWDLDDLDGLLRENNN